MFTYSTMYTSANNATAYKILSVFSLYADIPWQQTKWLDVTVLWRHFTFVCLSICPAWQISTLYLCDNVLNQARKLSVASAR